MHFSPLQLILVLVIVILLFGTKKLRNMGGDLGEAFKNFRRAVKDGDETSEVVDNKPAQQIPQHDQQQGRVIVDNKPVQQTPQHDQQQGRVIDVEVREKDKA